MAMMAAMNRIIVFVASVQGRRLKQG